MKITELNDKFGHQFADHSTALYANELILCLLCNTLLKRINLHIYMDFILYKNMKSITDYNLTCTEQQIKNLLE